MQCIQGPRATLRMDGEGDASNDLDRRKREPRLAFGGCRSASAADFIVSLFGMPGGALAAWLIVAAKSALHCAHLGKPQRFWRLLFRPGKSWLARGFIFVSLFLIVGAAQIACSSLSPGSAWAYPLKALAGFFALAVMTYIGFIMNRLRGIPLWNSTLLPALFFCAGTAGRARHRSRVHRISGGKRPGCPVRPDNRSPSAGGIPRPGGVWAGLEREKDGASPPWGPVSAVLWLGVVACGLVVPLIMLSVASTGAQGQWRCGRSHPRRRFQPALLPAEGRTVLSVDSRLTPGSQRCRPQGSHEKKTCEGSRHYRCGHHQAWYRDRYGRNQEHEQPGAMDMGGA